MEKSNILVTVFTPTYNRGHLLHKLYESLLLQTIKSFEWLVVDDGSSDNTEELFEEWLKKSEQIIRIRYIRKENGGKARAINMGLKEAKGEYFFIVDSDDYLADDAIETIIRWFNDLPKDSHFIGVSGVKEMFLNQKKTVFNFEQEEKYWDISNIQRPEYGLQADMAEVFYTEKLQKYYFSVWPSEKFLPESVVWDQIALDGYILRWYNKVIYYGEYVEGGLTKSTWKLLKENPMGYAQMYQIKLQYTKRQRQRINYLLQFLSCCFLAHQYTYIFQVKDFKLLLLIPLGFALSIRRRIQFKHFLK